MPRILQINTPLGPDNVVLTHLSGREELGRLPEYQLTLVAKKSGITPAELLGKNITVGLEIPGGLDVRYLNGFITRYADAGHATSAWFQEGSKGIAYQYQATLHPWLWFLTRRTNCRIFQHQTVPQIIQAICATYPLALLELQLTETHAAWEYCCQYRESDFNFISRLMEQEGIYYYFKHENGKHTMALCDAPGAHQPRKGYAQFSFNDHASQGTSDRESITEWHVSNEVQPGTYTLNDFNFEKPAMDLVAKASDPKTHDLSNFEYYDAPGAYVERDPGEKLARLRLEELHSQYQVISAAGTLRGVQPGCTFSLVDHPHASKNNSYLITSASYSISNNAPESGATGGATFHTSFQAISAKTNFRPRRLSAKPHVQGPQTAIVVGKAGEEIWLDKYGRVKVQFHWDRYSNADESSSCWVRVSQPWAGHTWGAAFWPRIGNEVIVEFLEGDPDRPIITGRVYNAQSMPPWELPANKTQSGIKTRSSKDGGNCNELRFEDKKGEEEIFIQAAKNKNILIKNDRTEVVLNNSDLNVKKDYKEKIEAEHHVTIHGDENVKLESGGFSFDVAQDWQGKMGGKMLVQTAAEIHHKSGASVFTKAADNIASKAGQDIRLKSGTDTHFKAGMNLAAEAGMNMHLKAGMSLVVEAGMSLTLKAGGAFITLGPSGVAISGTLVMINSGGAAGSGSGCQSPEDGTPCMPNAPKAPGSVAAASVGNDTKPKKPATPEVYSPQAQALKLAWQAATPFCMIA